jgi:polypeptide N-acetylgalactosaminyltransferase
MAAAAARRRCGCRLRTLLLYLSLLAVLPPLLLMLQRDPPAPLSFLASMTEQINHRHGYSTGWACRSDPPLPPESRPTGCSAVVDTIEGWSGAFTASVIVIAHNEASCALRRTLLAVLCRERTAPGQLEEVLVMDDDSAPPAEAAVAAVGNGVRDERVRWLRSDARLGVVRARMRAAREARAPVLVFLDAHCEPQSGWLQPLLAHLARTPRAIALPVIEPIDPRSWAYRPGPRPEAPPRGVIADWNLTFGWKQLSDAEVAARASDPLAPLAVPMMAGGVFAIKADWFFSSGGYDEGLEVWGLENVEMAVRVWTCGGGALHTLPCSRVGHVFRSAQPFSFPNGSGALTVQRNAWRVASVWMDEAAEALGLGRNARIGRMRGAADGLNERHELRRRLRCRSFRWYLEEVFPDHPKLPSG